MTKLWRKNTPFPFKGEGNQIGKEWWQWAKILLLYIPNDKSSYFLFSQSHQQELMLVQQIITYKVLEPIHSAKTTWPSRISITPNLQMRKLRLRMSRGLLSTSQCWFHDSQSQAPSTTQHGLDNFKTLPTISLAISQESTRNTVKLRKMTDGFGQTNSPNLTSQGWKVWVTQVLFFLRLLLPQVSHFP